MQKKQNILVIVTDQQRYDSLQSTGSTSANTVNIDALAKESSIFDRFISASAICSPSRASMLTGVHASVHGLWSNGIALPRAEETNIPKDQFFNNQGKWTVSNIPTFADLLKNVGYNTASIGKQHLSPVAGDACLEHKEGRLWESEPDKMNNWHGPYYGFDEVHLTKGHGEHIGGHYKHWLKENYPAVYDKVWNDGEHRKNLEFPECGMLYPSVVPQEAHNTTWISNMAVDYLNKEKDSENPFLLWVGYPDPHSPFVPPAELADIYKEFDVDMPKCNIADYVDKPKAMRDLMSKRDALNMNPELIKRIRQYTDALMFQIDEGVGKIIQALKDNDQWENTVVIYTSDHGDFLGDFGMHGKCVPCCKPLNHIPFIMRVPNKELPARVANTASNVDVLPTLCEIAGAKLPDIIHGESLFDVAKKGRDNLAMVQHYTPQPYRTNISVYDNRYRYTWYTDTNEKELYDHTKDPNELKNLVGIKKYQTEENRLHAELCELHTKNVCPRAGRVAMW